MISIVCYQYKLNSKDSKGFYALSGLQMILINVYTNSDRHIPVARAWITVDNPPAMVIHTHGTTWFSIIAWVR